MAPELTQPQLENTRQRFEREEIKQGVKWQDIQSLEKGFTAEDWQKIYGYQQTHAEVTTPPAAPKAVQPEAPSGTDLLNRNNKSHDIGPGVEKNITSFYSADSIEKYLHNN